MTTANFMLQAGRLPGNGPAPAIPNHPAPAERGCAVLLGPSSLQKLVLCVDDSPALLDITVMVLADSGFRVLRADNGMQGLNLALSNPVDIVVLDYDMPDLDGATVAAKIKAAKPVLPILLYSGHPAEVIQTPSGVVDGFVQKGESPRRLLAEVNRLLNGGISTRRFPRFAVESAYLRVGRKGQGSLPGRALDLGEGGLGAAVACDFRPGEVVQFELQLPFSGAVLASTARVCYRQGSSYGLEFVGLTAANKVLLRRSCRQLQQQLGSS